MLPNVRLLIHFANYCEVQQNAKLLTPESGFMLYYVCEQHSLILLKIKLCKNVLSL